MSLPKSVIRVVSNGNRAGTTVFVNGAELNNVTSIKWTITKTRNTVLLEILNPEIEIDASAIEKTTKSGKRKFIMKRKSIW
jgi:hypothetical protein